MATNEDSSDFIERLKGTVKKLAGTITGDDLLKHEGELNAEKADAQQKADRLEAEAAHEREQAEIVARERELVAEEQQLRTEENVEALEESLKREHEQEEQRIERAHRRRQLAVETEQQAQQSAITTDEVLASRERAADHSQANQLDDEAERARATAEALDRAADSPRREDH